LPGALRQRLAQKLVHVTWDHGFVLLREELFNGLLL
jgi:hypothetical protein